MARYTASKEVNAVIHALIKDGWIFTQNGHGRITHPSGRYITVSMTPNGKYTHKNVERDVKKLLQQLEKEKEIEYTEEN
jgi:predicted RNA binding protein YcfA (HicA-like mRNA interferase family)